MLPTAGGRVAGKVNINMMRDQANFSAVFRALADAQAGNSFIGPAATPDSMVDQVFTSFLNRRSPGGTTTILPTDQTLAANSNQPMTDNPIWSLSLGQASAVASPPSDLFLRTGSGTRGIENTLFQLGGTSLFEQNPPTQTHPYLKRELLRKIYGSVTTRSNVFAVWATVGFFEVDDSVSPARIGAEIGASENRQVRHRMFSIVDRTQMQMWPTASRTVANTSSVLSTTAIAFPVTTPPSFSVSAAVALQKDDGTPLLIGGPASFTRVDSASGNTWTLQKDAILVYEPNTDNEETVVVDSAGNATFYRSHNAGVAVVVRGNPGPLKRYDPRQDKDVVPYFGLID